MDKNDEKFQHNAELTKANFDAIATFREDMAASEEKRESKLNGMTVIMNNCVRILDQITYRMDTPQLGMTDRLNDLDDSQKKTAKILGEVQLILVPLCESSKQTRKWIDFVIGGAAIYLLTRLLPYIGQLLQKE